MQIVAAVLGIGFALPFLIGFGVYLGMAPLWIAGCLAIAPVGPTALAAAFLYWRGREAKPSAPSLALYMRRD